MDGADESTTFTDSALGGNAPHTVTANGDAQIDTAQYRYGGASGLFDGTGDYLTAPDSADWDFGTDDFTIEAWVRFSGLASEWQRIVGEGTGITGVGPLKSGWSFMYKHDETKLVLHAYNGSTSFNKEVTWTASLNTWYHLAVSRSGDNLKFFVDGTQQGSTIDVSGHSYDREEANGVYIARQASGGGPDITYLNGHIDELRITKGLARYT